jgi:HlyD family secretion protein
LASGLSGARWIILDRVKIFESPATEVVQVRKKIFPEVSPILLPVSALLPKPPVSRFLLALAALVLAGLMIKVTTIWRGPTIRPSAASSFATATIIRREFLRTLRLHGIVEAVEAHSIAVPQLAGPVQPGPGAGTLVITQLAHSGLMVKKGDLLVEFDRQTQIRNSLDRKAEYLDLQEQIKKKLAEQTAARARDETELLQAENAVEKAKLEVLKNEVVGRIQAEKNQLNLEEAKVRYQQLRETFELKRRAAKSELRILEIQSERARNGMLYAQANAEKMSIRSPVDGLIMVSTVWNDQKEQMAEIQEGEEVRPGSPILQVVNPSSMQVRVKVNQADLSCLRVGQAAQVVLDAYQGKTFAGRLEQMAPIGIASNYSEKVHTFTCIFSIQGADPLLIPDLSAAVDVELERVKDVLVAPRDSVGSEKDLFFVLVKEGSRSRKQMVSIGALSSHEVVIASGLEAGVPVLRNVMAGQNEF